MVWPRREKATPAQLVIRRVEYVSVRVAANRHRALSAQRVFRRRSGREPEISGHVNGDPAIEPSAALGAGVFLQRGTAVNSSSPQVE
jgi:hypothetical protein